MTTKTIPKPKSPRKVEFMGAWQEVKETDAARHEQERSYPAKPGRQTSGHLDISNSDELKQ